MNWLFIRSFCFVASVFLAGPSQANPCDPALSIQPSDNSGETAQEMKFLRKLQKTANVAEKKLFEMTHYHGARYLLSNELDQITKIYGSPLSLTEKAERSFQVYLNSRLASLTKADADKVREILRIALQATQYLEARPDLYQYAAGSFSCEFNPESGRMHWKVPNKFQKTALGYALLVHELEHAIQWVLLKDLPDSKSMKYTHYRFLKEFGAMKVEAEFLYGIPLQVRRQLLFDLHGEPDSEFKEVSLKMLTPEASTPEAHVEWQWKNNRYSKAIIEVVGSILGSKK